MGNSNYKLILEATIDPSKISATIKAIQDKNKLVLNVGLKQGDLGKLEGVLGKIEQAGNKISKLKLFESDAGGINKAVIEYTDKLGNALKTTKLINSEIIATKQHTIDLAKNEEAVLRIEKSRTAELEKAALNADKFLAKSQNMSKTSSVQAATAKAQEIKVAVSEGDLSKVRTLNKEFDILKASLQTGRTGLDSWATGMKNALKQTIEYAASVGLVYGALRQLKEAVEYVSELNKELTNIQIVTGYTDEQVGELAGTFNTLAKGLGATTLEVSKGSLEWFRQGKTIEETSKLMQSTMMMSKLGNMESAQATEYLTSILNGFKLKAEDAEDVVSRLVALDNAFATSTAEIASAMQRSSVSAQQAGVSMEELASMITVVSDVSRRAPENIGESFKTMFARYQDILAGQVDEDGMGINNVGKALERVGINIREVDGGFRDFSDVLDDLYPKWQSLNEVEQANILKALAGIRQRESLLVLLENETKYRKALTETMNSEGLAADRYSIYLESVEAAQNRVTASWEKLAQTSISSGTVSGFYNALAGLLEFLDAIGGLPTILSLIVVGLVGFYSGTISLTGALVGLETVLFAIEAMSPLGWIALATGAIIIFANLIETSEEKLHRLNEEISESDDRLKSLRNSAKSIRELGAEYDKLKSQTHLTSEETQRLLDIQNQLKELVPELSGNFDEYGNFILDSSNDMTALNDATLEQIRLEKELRETKVNEKAGTEAGALLDAQNRKNRFIEEAGRRGATETGKLQANLDWSNALKEAEVAFSQMSVEGRNAFIKELEASDSGREIAKIFIQQMKDEFNDAQYEHILGEKELLVEAGVQAAEYTYEGFSSTIKSLADDSDLMGDLIDKSIKGKLDFSDIEKIPEEYLDSLTVEGDKLKLNIDLIKEHQLQMANEAVESARSSGETLERIRVLELYASQLQESMYMTVDGIRVTTGAFNEMAYSIANDANLAGVTIRDMEGQALTSAESIYQFMSSGDAAFNSFVQQAATITGRSVQEIMAQINGMLQTTANNAAALINYLGASSLGVDSGFNRAPAMPNFGGAIFNGAGNPGGYSGSGGGGGGSGSSAADKREQRRQEREREAQERAAEIEKQIDDARQNAIDNLKDQLDLYKDIIDAREKILDTMADERDYQNDVADKNREILNVQNQLATLQFDTSEAAQARRLELQDELLRLQGELEDIQYTESVEDQKDALDAEYQAFQTQINSAIKAIEEISAGSVGSFATQLAAILSGLSLPAFHSGAEKGVVGGNGSASIKSNEVLAKLMTGELVVNQAQADAFIKKTLPQLIEGASSMSGGNIQIDMPINVAGSLDKAAIPELKKMMEAVMKELNDSLGNRGINRRVDSYSI